MKKVAGKLRLELAQFRELQAFVQFASDVDDVTKKKIKRGQIITEILKQSDLAPLSFDKQVIVLYAALNNYFDEIPEEKLAELQEKLLNNIEKVHDREILEPLKKTGILSKEVEEKLKQAIENIVKI